MAQASVRASRTQFDCHQTAAFVADWLRAFGLGAIGNGDSVGLHHPAYEFNDADLPVGASFFARLVEPALPLG